MSRPVLARSMEAAAVALARDFRVEAKPIDIQGAAVLRISKGRDAGTVYVDRTGALVGWRTGGCPAVERLKATLEQLTGVRA